jgi:hypothetical protein
MLNYDTYSDSPSPKSLEGNLCNLIYSYHGYPFIYIYAIPIQCWFKGRCTVICLHFSKAKTHGNLEENLSILYNYFEQLIDFF